MSKRVYLITDFETDSGLLRSALKSDGAVEIVGENDACWKALIDIQNLNLNVVLLDITRHGEEGIALIKQIKMSGDDIEIILIVAPSERKSSITYRAIALGIFEVILKPVSMESSAVKAFAAKIRETVAKAGEKNQQDRNILTIETKKSYTMAELLDKANNPPPKHFNLSTFDTRKNPGLPDVTPRILVIGISTGGPQALRILLRKLNADFPVPILISQHIPPLFAPELVKELSRITKLKIKIAEDQEPVRKGIVYIAPGDHHLRIARERLRVYLTVDQKERINGHRPSVDPLFQTAAAIYGKHTLAIIMTGMGNDGVEGIGEVFRRGGICLAQDRASSAIYGMPGTACQKGYIHESVPLGHMHERILALVERQEEESPEGR